jgi:hypothetical protein
MNRNRGFVILIVLAVIATASVILATQLSAVQPQQGAEIRVAEETKARDIAEYCLGIADAYVFSFATQAANQNKDFDSILDPDGVIGTADDFMPPDSLITGTTPTIVKVPASASGCGTCTHYHWKAFNITAPAAAGSTAGVCLIRYDDNADDSNNTLDNSMTSNTNGVVEGNGIDVPERDRDRTIIASVIGLVPQQSDITTAYAKAHARATVRRVRALPKAAAAGFAIQAGGNVDFGTSGNVVCGAVGGIQATNVTGTVCVCGALDANNNGSATIGGCAGCSPCASGTQGPPIAQPPTVTVPPFSSVYQNDGPFATEAAMQANTTGTASPTNISAASFNSAVVLFRDGAQSNPNNANAPYGVGPNQYDPATADTDVFAWDPKDPDVTALFGAKLTDAAGVLTNCTDTSAQNPLPRACNWTLDASGNPTAINCGTGESACWKLVARLGDGINAANIDALARARGEQIDIGGNFMAKSGPLPNFFGTTQWSDVAGGSCNTCGAGAEVTHAAANAWTTSPQTVAGGPHMFALIDTPSTSTVTMNSAASEPQEKLSVFTTAAISFSGNQCCAAAGCTCPATCDTASGFSSTANGPGFVMRTNKSCSASGTFKMFGYLQCPEFDLGQNDDCIVGGFVLNQKPGDIDCGGGGMPDPPCDNAGFCVKNNFKMVGDLFSAGTICAKNNLNVSGGKIETQQSMGFKNNTLSNANQLIAVGNIEVKNGNTFQFDGTVGTGNNQGIAQTMWMDAAW